MALSRKLFQEVKVRGPGHSNRIQADVYLSSCDGNVSCTFIMARVEIRSVFGLLSMCAFMSVAGETIRRKGSTHSAVKDVLSSNERFDLRE